MNGLDIFFFLLLGYTLVRGLYRGLVWELGAIIGLVLAFFLAHEYYTKLMPLVSHLINSHGWAAVVSYVIIFLAVLVAVVLLARALSKLLKFVSLSWADRTGGAVFGLLKGTLICSLILLTLTIFLTSKSKLISSSRISPYLILVTRNVASYIPEHIRNDFLEKDEDLQRIWKGKLFQDLSGKS